MQLDNSCDINLLPKRRKKQRGDNDEEWLNDDDVNDEMTDLVIDGHNSDEDHFQNEDPELYEKPPRIVNLDLLDQFVPKG